MTRSLFAAFLAVTAFTAPAYAACPTDSMTPDMYHAYVEGIQKTLTEQGFRPGVIDGKIGPNTRSAIRAYQKAAKLPVDGCPTQELLDHINFSQPKVYGPGKR